MMAKRLLYVSQFLIYAPSAEAGITPVPRMRMPIVRKGFTLIELLIVVVIIGILASIAIPKFKNTKEKAYIAAMKEDVRNVASAEEAYLSDHNGFYAPDIATLGTAYKPSAGVTITLLGTASTWRATARNPMTTVTCRLAANTNKSYDGAIVCK